MNKHDKPSAESAGNDDRSAGNLDIGTRALSQQLLTEVIELVSRYIEALPDAIDCDRECEMQFYSTRMMRLTPKPEASENGDGPS